MLFSVNEYLNSFFSPAPRRRLHDGLPPTRMTFYSTVPFFAFVCVWCVCTQICLKMIVDESVKEQTMGKLAAVCCAYIVIRHILFSGLMGHRSEFHNLKSSESRVYCTWCSGLLGAETKNGSIVVIRRRKLIRVDPKYAISICTGKTHDDGGRLISHGHLSSIASVDNPLNAPLERVQFKSMRNGSFLKELCPFARKMCSEPPSSPIVQRFFDIHNAPVPLSIPPILISDDEASIEQPIPEVQSERASNAQVKVETASENVKESLARCVRKRVMPLRNETSRRNFEEFIRNQPSTSNSVYEKPVQQLIDGCKKLKQSQEDNAVGSVISTILLLEICCCFSHIFLLFLVLCLFFSAIRRLRQRFIRL